MGEQQSLGLRVGGGAAVAGAEPCVADLELAVRGVDVEQARGAEGLARGRVAQKERQGGKARRRAGDAVGDPGSQVVARGHAHAVRAHVGPQRPLRGRRPQLVDVLRPQRLEHDVAAAQRHGTEVHATGTVPSGLKAGLPRCNETEARPRAPREAAAPK